MEAPDVPDDINAKLPNRTLHITKGADCTFTVRRRDPQTGDPVDWDAEVYTLIQVSRSQTERFDADVVDSAANVLIDYTLLDGLKTGTTWQVIMSRNDVETPVLVGTFERNDGKQ